MAPAVEVTNTRFCEGLVVGETDGLDAEDDDEPFDEPQPPPPPDE
jgi:hypothetical protein